MYTNGLNTPFTVTPVNWGSIHVTPSVRTTRANKTITVTYPEGAVVSYMIIQDFDAHDVKYELDRDKRTYTFTMPKRNPAAGASL